MKIYITLLILLFSLKINAQVISKDELKEKATFMGYKYYFNNEKIKKQKAIQILLQNKSSEVLVNKYQKTNKLANFFGYSGAIMTGIVGGLVISKMLTHEILIATDSYKPTATEVIFLILGSAGIVTGFSLKLKANKQLKSSITEFNNNNSKEATIKIGMTKNGNVGFVLNF